MSYYGGGGGGWGQPIPPNTQVPPGYYPPNQGQGLGPPVNNQPPPFYSTQPTDSSLTSGLYPQSFVQPYVNATTQVTAPSYTFSHNYSLGQSSEASHSTAQYTTSVPVSTQHAAATDSFIRERGRPSDQYSPSRRRSPSPGRRASGSRGRDSARGRTSRSPSEEKRPMHRESRPRKRSPEEYNKGHESQVRRDRQDHKEMSQKKESGQSAVDIDSLLKDERLRNVLFAGLSKATAKLEQSLKKGKDVNESATSAESSSEGKSHLFPSASTSQPKPRSILKRKPDPGEGDVDANAYNNLTTLEKTLQLLRGKSDLGDLLSSKSVEQTQSKSHGALGKLASYDDGNEEESYLYGDKNISPVERKKKTSAHPFWSVGAVSSPGKEERQVKESDTFESKEKLFEKWRKSIQKSPERPSFQGGEVSRDSRSTSSRISPTEKQGGGQEELDSTVQNILQSIGFDFDLSQRMQQLARKKKVQEEERDTGISNQSASFLGKKDLLSEEFKTSFLGKKDLLTEEFKASLLQSGNDLSKIDSLLQEAKLSALLEKARKSGERSVSPARRRDQRRDLGGAKLTDEQSRSKKSRSDWSDNEPDDGPRWQSRQVSRNYESISPQDDRFNDEDSLIRSSFHVSKPAKEKDQMNEYYYPEKESIDMPPGLPLRPPSYNARQTNEDLSGGLLKSMRVENFRVMSRPVYDDGNEEFTETRRVILPAKSERSFLSRSRSPSPGIGSRKRSGSPLSVSAYKGRRIITTQQGAPFAERREDGPNFDRPFGRNSPVSRRSFGDSLDRSPVSRGSIRRRDSVSPDRMPIGGYRSPSPMPSRGGYRSPSPLPSRGGYKALSPLPSRGGYRSPSPLPSRGGYRSPSPLPSRGGYKALSPLPSRGGYRSPSPLPSRGGYKAPSPLPSRRRSRSPGYRRSRSPGYRRSRSPRRYRSRSPVRNRSRSPRRRRSRSPRRHRGGDARKPMRHSPSRDRRISSNPRRRSRERRADPKSAANKKDEGIKKSDAIKKSVAKPKSTPSQTNPRVDFTKLSDEERKAHLQKLLKEKNIEKPSGSSLQEVVVTLEKMAPLDLDRKTQLFSELAKLSEEGKAKSLCNANKRFAQFMTLKVEVVKLKKQQNELMRKNQRSGKGAEDSQLAANEKLQAKLEEELDRLSAPSLDVKVNDISLELEWKAPPEESQAPKKSKDASQKIEKNAQTAAAATAASKKDDSTSKVVTEAKKKAASKTVEQASAPDDVNKNKWKSVAVKDELPEIGGAAKKSSNNKTKADSKTKASSNSKPAAKETLPSREKNIYFEYIDSSNHFCRHCQVPCTSLKNLFDHWHGKKHQLAIRDVSKPWDDQLKEPPKRNIGQARTRRIKGAEMLAPVIGFYCTLCKLYCPDNALAEKHLKTDSHYDKYLDYIRANPKYEKNMLLERTKLVSSDTQKEERSSVPEKGKKKGHQEKEGRGKEEKKAHLRVKADVGVDAEEVDTGTYDKLGAVDMELDEEDVRNDDVDVKSKVPKMVAKPPLPFLPPPPPEPCPDDNRKTSKEDKVQPLDTFLTIQPDDPSSGQTSSVVKLEIIPEPVEMEPPKLPDVEAIPLPIEQVIHTAKTLKEVKEEKRKVEEEKERKAMEEEKRMMGIDVDDEEDTPLAAVKAPPMLPSPKGKEKKKDDTAGEAKAETSKPPTNMDSLFAKLNKNAGQKRKAKVSIADEPTEMEKQIQEGITAKVKREKEKIILKKQKAEEKERRREEKLLQKKKIYSDSSSEESDSEDDHAEESVVVEGNAPVVNEPNQNVGQEIGQQSSYEELYPQFPNGEMNPQFANQETNPQFANQEMNPQFANQELYTQFDNQEMNPQFANQEMYPQFTNQEMNPQYANQEMYPQYANQEMNPQFTNVEMYPQAQVTNEGNMMQQVVHENAGVNEGQVATGGDGSEMQVLSSGYLSLGVGAQNYASGESQAPSAGMEEGESAPIVSTTNVPVADNLSESSGLAHRELHEEKNSAAPKTLSKGKKPTKKSSVAVMPTESDILSGFTSAMDTVSQDAKKKLNKKGVRKIQAKKKDPGQEVESMSKEKEISMGDFVVLSELTEEDGSKNVGDVPEDSTAFEDPAHNSQLEEIASTSSAAANAIQDAEQALENAKVAALTEIAPIQVCPSESDPPTNEPAHDGNSTSCVEEPVEKASGALTEGAGAEPENVIDNLTVAQSEIPMPVVPEVSSGRGRGRKSGGRGRGRGKRGAQKTVQATEESISEDVSLTTSLDSHEESELSFSEKKSVVKIETLETDEAERSPSPSPNKRTRRGRAAQTPRRVTRSRQCKNQEVAENEEASLVQEVNEQEVVFDQQAKTSEAVNEQEVVFDQQAKTSEAVSDEESCIAAIPNSTPTLSDVSAPNVSLETDYEGLLLSSADDVNVNNSLEEKGFAMETEAELLSSEPTLAAPFSESGSKDESDSDATVTEDPEDVAVVCEMTSPDAQQSSISMCTGNTFEDDVNQQVMDENEPQMLDYTSFQSNLTEVDGSVAASQMSMSWDQAGFGNTGMQQVLQSMEEPTMLPLETVAQNRPRDPPMSGVIGEIEAPDGMVVHMVGDDVAEEMTAQHHDASEGLPTSGLGFDLEDVPDSMTFPLDDDSGKNDPSHSL